MFVYVLNLSCTQKAFNRGINNKFSFSSNFNNYLVCINPYGIFMWLKYISIFICLDPYLGRTL